MTQPVALLLTLLTEGLVVVALVRAARWRPPTLARWITAAACASLLTHPVAWWANGALPLPLWPRALLIEAAVVLAEAGLYRALAPTDLRRAFAAAALANGASFGLGVLLTI